MQFYSKKLLRWGINRKIVSHLESSKIVSKFSEVSTKSQRMHKKLLILNYALLNQISLHFVPSKLAIA